MIGRDHIRIHGADLGCVIGVHAEERHREQPIRYQVELGLDLAKAGYSGKIGDTCDYAEVSKFVGALLQFRRYRLLEVAVHEIAAMLFGLYAPLETVEVRLEKPEALQGKASAVVGIHRVRADFPRRREAARFGAVDVLGENSEAGLYLLHVEPGQSIPSHFHRVMRELEWLVAGELLRDGSPCVRGEPVVWTRGHVHRYDNVSNHPSTLFCCDTPPFIPSDEVLATEGTDA